MGIPSAAVGMLVCVIACGCSKRPDSVLTAYEKMPELSAPVETLAGKPAEYGPEVHVGPMSFRPPKGYFRVGASLERNVVVLTKPGWALKPIKIRFISSASWLGPLPVPDAVVDKITRYMRVDEFMKAYKTDYELDRASYHATFADLRKELDGRNRQRQKTLLLLKGGMMLPPPPVKEFSGENLRVFVRVKDQAPHPGFFGMARMYDVQGLLKGVLTVTADGSEKDITDFLACILPTIRFDAKEVVSTPPASSTSSNR